MDMSRLGFILSGIVFAGVGGLLVIVVYVLGLALFGVDSVVSKVKRWYSGRAQDKVRVRESHGDDSVADQQATWPPG